MFCSKKTMWNHRTVRMAAKVDVIANVATYLLVAVGFTVVGVNNANADYTFSTPINLGSPVNTSSDDSGSISPDSLTLFLYSDRPGGHGAWDIWTTTRAAKNEPWGEPVNLGTPINSASHDYAPSISTNGLELYFASNRGGVFDLWVATRATTEDNWGAPVSLGPTVNSSSYDGNGSISADGLSLYFTSDRSGGEGVYDLWVTTRATISDPWGTPVNLGPTVNSSAYEDAPSVSADGLLLFFGSNRPGGYGDWDVWVARRATTGESWSTPVNLGPTVNTTSAEDLPSVSHDGFKLYFSDIVVCRPGGVGKSDVWQVPIEPIVDLNGDGTVDAADMCIVVDHWGTDNRSCDIGPMPWGDGIVDVEDLIVLSEHLFEEFPPAQ